MPLVRSGFVALAFASLAGSLAAQTTTLVSAAQGQQGSDASGGPTISDDGFTIAFWSSAFDLVPGDTNQATDVFVQSRKTGQIRRVSVSSLAVEGNLDSDSPCISGDGRVVAFVSSADNLVLGDANGARDVFVHELATATTTLVSISSSGVQANKNCVDPSLTQDGTGVAFWSTATSLSPIDTNTFADVYFHDRTSGATEVVSLRDNHVQPVPGNNHSVCQGLRRYVSADGRYVAFESLANDLVSSDTNVAPDVFRRDRLLDVTERVSVGVGGAEGDSRSVQPSISRDGQRVAFTSLASNLAAGDANGVLDVFVRDVAAGTTTLVSKTSGGVIGSLPSDVGVIDPTGAFVAFTSAADNLVAGDVNGSLDVFVHALAGATTTMITVSNAGAIGNADAFELDLSPNAAELVYATLADNLAVGDQNQNYDVLLYDRVKSAALASYCTAKQNSVGCTPYVALAGLPRVAITDDFYVAAGDVRSQTTGVMLWSLSSASTPFGHGTLCVQLPAKRTRSTNAGGASNPNCSGAFSFHFTTAYMAQEALSAGTTVYAQWWSRDPGYLPRNDVGLTDAASFTLVP